MANFTIMRKPEASDNYGCTPFETNQTEGEVASLVSGNPLDGSIIWYLDANAGYTVNVNDFNIPGTTATAAVQIPGVYRTFEGGGIPAPVLGIVFEQVTSVRIKITLFLHPIGLHFITGTVFTMPPTAVAASINIDGCATLIGTTVFMALMAGDEVIVESTLSSDIGETLESEDLSGGVVAVTGFIPVDKVNDELLSYTIKAKEGERFLFAPYFTISTDDHYTTSSTVKNDSGDIISTTIKIYKTT